MSTTLYSAVYSGIETYFETNWSATTAYGPNELHEPTTDVPYIRFSIDEDAHERLTHTGQDASGRMLEGTLAIDVFVPVDTGTVTGTVAGISNLMDSLRGIFNDQKEISLSDGNTLVFESGSPSVEPDGGDGWFAKSYDVPFYVFEGV